MQKRAEFAAKYLKGHGIEIGALHVPTPVPQGVSVTYVDQSPEEVNRHHGDVVPKVSDWRVDDAETLLTFEPGVLDFVMAHHVLEHLDSPLNALETWLYTVKPGGVVIFALPDKRFTFDKKRAITTFEHIVADYFGEKNRSRFEHMLDWYANSEHEGATGSDVVLKAREADRSGANVHFHVWDYDAMQMMLARAKDELKMPFDLLEMALDGFEAIFALRRI